jgi:hypothetical protein
MLEALPCRRPGSRLSPRRARAVVMQPWQERSKQSGPWRDRISDLLLEFFVADRRRAGGRQGAWLLIQHELSNVQAPQARRDAWFDVIPLTLTRRRRCSANSHFTLPNDIPRSYAPCFMSHHHVPMPPRPSPSSNHPRRRRTPPSLSRSRLARPPRPAQSRHRTSSL